MNRRKLYFAAKHDHRNVGSKANKKSPNYPALRTFRSKIDADTSEIVKKFNFYLPLTGIRVEYERSGGAGRNFHHHLERIARQELNLTLSNYTIDGILLAERYGPRHNPTPRVKRELRSMTNYFESLCKKIGTWKPFVFKFAKEETQ